MLNYFCIRIGIAENVTLKQSLSTRKRIINLQEDNVPTYSDSAAISKAVGIMSNYKKTLKQHPQAKKTVCNQKNVKHVHGFRIMGKT